VSGAPAGATATVVDAPPTEPDVLELRNLGLAPNEELSIDITVTTPCSAGTYTWAIRAKQSNDFSGPPGNDFFPQEEGTNLHTDVGGAGGTAAALVFRQQPTSGAKNAPISPAVAVEVVDSCGNATTPTGSVTLALNDGDTTFGGGGTLTGTTPTVSGALFTFGSLAVTGSGAAYTLTASYPGVPSVESDPFDVYDMICTSGSGCTASNETTGTQVDVQGFGGTAGVSVGPATNSLGEIAGDCGSGLTALGSTFAIVPLSGTSGTYTAVLTIAKRGLQGIGVSNIVVCVSADADGPFVKLSKCPKKGQQPEKCVVSQTSSNAGDAIITMRFSGDPYGGGFG